LKFFLLEIGGRWEANSENLELITGIRVITFEVNEAIIATIQTRQADGQ